MKRPLVICFMAALALIIFLTATAAIKMEDLKFFTGEASSMQTNISINVVAIPPTISIISPLNDTYLSNTSILLNYSASENTLSVWYNLDSGENTTIYNLSNSGENTITTEPVRFNVSEGGHTLYLFALSHGGSASSSVAFSANTTKFIIYYNKWKGSNKGNSTDFNSYTFGQIQSLNSIVLENTAYAKIRFNQAINLTADLNSADNILDLDSNINTSYTWINLNSTELPNFNKPATLWFYGLTFSNPRILIDGEVCPSAVCREESYSSGTLVFNVSIFSYSYAVEETPGAPAPSPVTPGGGGGGGGGVGGVVRAAEEFIVEPDFIEVVLQPGQSKTSYLRVISTSNKSLSITATLKGLEAFAKLGETSFVLNANETKSLKIDFFAANDTLGIYTGRITVKGGNTEKTVYVVVDVSEAGALFDVKITVLPDYKQVLAGDEVVSIVRLINAGSQEQIDVKLKLQIMDFENRVLRESVEETLAMRNQLSIIRGLTVPAESALGKYVVVASAKYGDLAAESYDTFEVVESKAKAEFAQDAQTLFILTAIALLALYFTLAYKRRKKKKQQR